MPRRVGEALTTSATLPADALGRSRALHRGALGDVVGVAGLGGDGEVGALGQAGERVDDAARQVAVLLGVEEDLVDVPVGVVVGEDRGAQVLGAAGGLEVAGGGADRVDRVVGILAAVAVGVDAVGLPGRGHELHPAEGAGGGDVEVGAERGLDAVDRGEHLPRDPVLGSAGLVDREQEGRDRELVDDEVGDADRGGAEVGDRDGGVGVGRACRRRCGCPEPRRASARHPHPRLEAVAELDALSFALEGVVDVGELAGSSLLALAAASRLIAAVVVGRLVGVGLLGDRLLGSGLDGLVALVAVGDAGAAGIGHIDGAVAVVVGLVAAGGEDFADDREVAAVRQVDGDIGLAHAEVDIARVDRAGHQNGAEDAKRQRDQKPVLHTLSKSLSQNVPPQNPLGLRPVPLSGAHRKPIHMSGGMQSGTGWRKPRVSNASCRQDCRWA